MFNQAFVLETSQPQTPLQTADDCCFHISTLLLIRYMFVSMLDFWVVIAKTCCKQSSAFNRLYVPLRALSSWLLAFGFGWFNVSGNSHACSSGSPSPCCISISSEYLCTNSSPHFPSSSELFNFTKLIAEMKAKMCGKYRQEN